MEDITNLIYMFNQAAAADSYNRARGQRNLIALQGVQGNLYSAELKRLSEKSKYGMNALPQNALRIKLPDQRLYPNTIMLRAGTKKR